MHEKESVLGPFFFVMYIAIAVLVILNVIIAIISDACVRRAATAVVCLFLSLFAARPAMIHTHLNG